MIAVFAAFARRTSFGTYAAHLQTSALRRERSARARSEAFEVMTKSTDDGTSSRAARSLLLDLHRAVEHEIVRQAVLLVIFVRLLFRNDQARAGADLAGRLHALTRNGGLALG